MCMHKIFNFLYKKKELKEPMCIIFFVEKKYMARDKAEVTFNKHIKGVALLQYQSL